MHLKIRFKQVCGILRYLGLRTAHKFMQLPMNTYNIIYYIFLQLTIQYEYSTILILYKTSSGCIKNCHLNKLFAISVILAP
jgi:hypothetical protein